MIVDCHAHLPRAGAANSAEDVPADGWANGVSVTMVSSLGEWSPFPDEREVAEANLSARRFAETLPDRVRWYVYLNPLNENWRRELDEGIAAGAVGIKLWISLKDNSGDMSRTSEVLGRAGELDVPVLFHTYNRTDDLLPGELDVRDVADLARRFPATKMIAAHAGGNWRQTMAILHDGPPNTFVDISGCYPEAGMVDGLVAALGRERVLFGSDLPARTVASQLAKVLFSGLDDESKEDVLWRNAARLFRLENLAASESSRGDPISGTPDVGTDHFCFSGSVPFFPAGCSCDELDARLASIDVETAYVADLRALFTRDLAEANAALLRAARKTQRIKPLSVVNPRSHDWRAVVDFACDDFAGVMVSPYVQDWRLDDETHAELFRLLSERRRPVWVNCALGDHRFRHSALASRPVSGKEVGRFLGQAPRNRYVFQGLGLAEISAAARCAEHPEDVRFEVSRLTDKPGALREAMGLYGDRLVLGSEFPLRDLDQVAWTMPRV